MCAGDRLLQHHSSAFEGVLYLVSGLLHVARGLAGAPFGLEPAISGNAPGAFLGFTFGCLGLVPDFLENAHGTFLFPGSHASFRVRMRAGPPGRSRNGSG